MTEPGSIPSQHQGQHRAAVIGLFAGPAIAAAVYLLLGSSELDHPARAVAGMGVLMALWWMTEAIPLAATSLLPLVLMPVLGVSTTKVAAAPYAHELIFLFMGGLIIGLSLEKWGTHKRIALAIILAVGTSPRRIVAGFMIATAVLSAFISNTAAAIMLLPIGMCVADLESKQLGDRDPGGARFGVCLMLGIAYAASVGGMATITGTPPNAILIAFMGEQLGVNISFASWLKVGLPLAAIMLPITWAWLVMVAFPVRPGELPGGRKMIREQIGTLGRVSRGEVSVMVVFACVALGWVLRGPLTAWTGLTMVGDATIAIAGAIALFMIPVDLKRGVFAMDWRTAVRLPWGVLLLFGGGLSLARAVTATGLDVWIGESMTGLGTPPEWVVILVVTAVVVFLTEITSNTATASAMLPVVAAAGPALGVDPALLVIPAALAASCAFMLPVATPPNAIVFSSGRVSIRQMAGAGLGLNLIGIVVITLLTVWLVKPALGVG